MPKSIEAQGVTVDEAIQNALNALGLGRDSVEIEILHHPRAGFLGIGARRAKVRATQREQVMRDGEEFDMSPDGATRGGRRRRRSGRRRSGRSGEARGRSGADAQPSEPTRAAATEIEKAGPPSDGQRSHPARSEPRSQRPEGRGRRGGRPRGGSEGRRVAEARGQRESRPDSAQPGAPTGGSNRPATEPKTSPRGADERSRRRSDAGATPKMEPETLRDRARELTTRLLNHMGFDADVDARLEDASSIEVAVRTDDPEGVLVGRRGTTLDALEHLVNRMTVGADPASRVRVSVDVCGYRGQRRAALAELARRLREHVLATRKRAQVTPLSPTDRIALQEALAGDEEVTTRIAGSGYYRRVVVAPRDRDNDLGGPAAEFSDEGYLLSSGDEGREADDREEYVGDSGSSGGESETGPKAGEGVPDRPATSVRSSDEGS
jgi:spoIIIJ-associated protein